VKEEEIRKALRDLFTTQGLIVEPSSVVTTAFVKAFGPEMEEPIAVIYTGENIAREDFWKMISVSASG
jgi:threonine dehydratase